MCVFVRYTVTDDDFMTVYNQWCILVLMIISLIYFKHQSCTFQSETAQRVLNTNKHLIIPTVCADPLMGSVLQALHHILHLCLCFYR